MQAFKNRVWQVDFRYLDATTTTAVTGFGYLIDAPSAELAAEQGILRAEQRRPGARAAELENVTLTNIPSYS